MHRSTVIGYGRFIFTTAFFWLSLEAMAWFILPHAPTLETTHMRQDELMPFHPNRIWSPKPHSRYTRDGVSYEHNAVGLRHHTRFQKPILVGIGDSSTYGFGVHAQDTFLHQTAACAEMGLINGGVSGYSSSQSLQLLREILSQNEGIEWVVLANLWSDLMRTNQSDDDYMSGLDRLAVHQKISSQMLYSKSPAVRLLSQVWFTTIKPLPPPLPVNRILVGDDTGTLRRVSLAQYIENTKSMIELSRSHGAEPIILLLPSNSDGGNGLDETVVQYRLAADKLAYDAGVELVDMEMVYNPLPQNSRKSRFIDEVHPSVHGHADIASELCEIVRLDENN